jgi:hypothetical protein
VAMSDELVSICITGVSLSLNVLFHIAIDRRHE